MLISDAVNQIIFTHTKFILENLLKTTKVDAIITFVSIISIMESVRMEISNSLMSLGH